MKPADHTQSPLFLRSWRQYRVLSQEEVAELAGMARESIVRLENGKRGARPATIRKLAKALRIEPHELMGPPPYFQEVVANRPPSQ